LDAEDVELGEFCKFTELGVALGKVKAFGKARE